MFSDQPTSAVWVGGLTAQCRASDVSAVLSRWAARPGCLLTAGLAWLVVWPGCLLAARGVGTRPVGAALGAWCGSRYRSRAADQAGVQVTAATSLHSPASMHHPLQMHSPGPVPARSFGAIRALRMGPAPSGGPAAEAGGQQAAEVYFESVGQAAAALTGLNAVVVPRLSGGRALTVQCWQQEAGGGGGGGQPSAAATPLLHAAPAVQKAKGTGAASPPPPRPPPQASRVQQQQQEVRCVNMAEAAAAVQLPGLEQLPAALDFFRSCCFRAVPGEPRGRGGSRVGRSLPACSSLAGGCCGVQLAACSQPPASLLPGLVPAPAQLQQVPARAAKQALPHTLCSPAPPATPAAEQEQGSAVKWAVLQALLARGLRHLSGAAFRQLPVLLTKAGDELLKVLPAAAQKLGRGTDVLGVPRTAAAACLRLAACSSPVLHGAAKPGASVQPPSCRLPAVPFLRPHRGSRVPELPRRRPAAQHSARCGTVLYCLPGVAPACCLPAPISPGGCIACSVAV